MDEIAANLHMHTPYSDGQGSHAEIAQAALQAGLEAVIVTDHNVWVDGPAGYYGEGDRRVLLLVGEEIHDQSRSPQKNHLLVFGAGRELAPLAYDLPRLLAEIRRSGGLAFLAHPVDPASQVFGEPDLSWVDWDITDYTGIELWNAMSEFKGLLKSRLHGLYYALNPRRVARGPYPQTLKLWDDLLSRGRPVVAVGGSDAHEFKQSLGPLRRTVFPYEFHFRAVNTHLLLDAPLRGGDAAAGARLVLDALRAGHAFVGYDLPASTRGFRFTAHGMDGSACMGDRIQLGSGVTLQIHLPEAAECLLLKDGQVAKAWRKREASTYLVTAPGVYRVEAYREYLGRRRGWIFSNPIYVRREI